MGKAAVGEPDDAGAVPAAVPVVDIARELGTLDLLSSGRLVVIPTVSWHRDEYDALGVDLTPEGRLLDEQLEIWAKAWGPSPMSHHGDAYSFENVWFEPKAYRRDGPRLWMGGGQLRGRVLERIVRYGHGFNPLGRRTDEEMATLNDTLQAAGRDPADLELVGGVRAAFRGADDIANFGVAMESIVPQWQRGYRTFWMKPSQFTDDRAAVGSFCRQVIRRSETVLG